MRQKRKNNMAMMSKMVQDAMGSLEDATSVETEVGEKSGSVIGGLAGALAGGVAGIVLGGITGGVTNESTGSGVWRGMLTGLLAGATIGGVAGAIVEAKKPEFKLDGEVVLSPEEAAAAGVDVSKVASDAADEPSEETGKTGSEEEE